MIWVSIVRVLHILSGGVALASLWVPLFARKGSKLHVRVGRVYAWAMGCVAASGAPLALRAALSADRSTARAGVFLFFVGLLAFDNAWMGVRALRTKSRVAPNRRAIDLAPPAALFVGAIGVFAMGARNGVALHVVFALLGAVLAVVHVAFWLRVPESRGDSIRLHISAMGASCIATITAFLVVNARHFGLGSFSLVVWTAPGVIGAVAIAWAQRSWRARLSRPR